MWDGREIRGYGRQKGGGSMIHDMIFLTANRYVCPEESRLDG